MRPVTFDGNFGFIHDASGDCAVIMCSAMGHEHLCASRGWRELACDIASVGFPVLRFDWPGCGDSLGTDADPRRVAAWRDALICAVSFARRTLGLNRVVLLGLRLGGALAAITASDVGAEALILLAPAISGRAYLRELGAMRSVGVTPSASADGYEVAGFLVTSETQASLNELDLRKLGAAPAKEVLLVTPGGQVHADALEESLHSLGACVTCEPFDGYEAYLADITLSQIPRATFRRVADWLHDNIALSPRGTFSADLPSPYLQSPTFTETPVQFGANRSLFGVHCQPNIPDPAKVAIIILNTGLNPHIGWARLGVLMARHFAEQGISSFRIDAAGIGDSPPVTGRHPIPVYDQFINADVRAAIDVMKAAGHEKILLFGTCSGAYLAFYTGLEDTRVDGLLIVNLEKFIWREGHSLIITQGFKGNSFYLGRLRDMKTWKRLFRGELDLMGLAPELLGRIGRLVRTRFREAGRYLHNVDDDTTKVRSWMRQLADRGVPVLMAYAEEDAARDELILHFGRNARWLRQMKQAEVSPLVAADHAISSASARAGLLRLLEAFIGRHFGS